MLSVGDELVVLFGPMKLFDINVSSSALKEVLAKRNVSHVTVKNGVEYMGSSWSPDAGDRVVCAGRYTLDEFVAKYAWSIVEDDEDAVTDDDVIVLNAMKKGTRT